MRRVGTLIFFLDFKTPYCFPQWLNQFTFPSTVYNGTLFSTSSPTFVTCVLLDDPPGIFNVISWIACLLSPAGHWRLTTRSRLLSMRGSKREESLEAGDHHSFVSLLKMKRMWMIPPTLSQLQVESFKSHLIQCNWASVLMF